MAPRDDDLRALANDVAAQPDPRSTSELQPEPDGFTDRPGHVLRQAGWLQHDQQAAGSPGQRRQPMQSIREARWPATLLTDRNGPWTRVLRPERRGQIDEQQVHRPTLEQRPGDAQPLVQGLRRQDDEPLQPNAARDGLHRIERAREIQIRDDRAASLCLRSEPERERGLAAGRIAVHRDTRQPWHAARAKDRVQCREPGLDDPPVIELRRTLRGPIVERPRDRCERISGHVLHGQRQRRECPDRGRVRRVPHRPRSCRAPASLEVRESGSDLGRGAGHAANTRTSVLLVKPEVGCTDRAARARQTVGAPRPASSAREFASRWPRDPNRSSGGHLPAPGPHQGPIPTHPPIP